MIEKGAGNERQELYDEGRLASSSTNNTCSIIVCFKFS